jgi:acetyl-CoA decarbonylase/synthase complex subunit beta
MAELPVEIGPMYEGERIRAKQMYVEFGGPKAIGAELVQARSMEEVEDGKIEIIGPDLNEMEEGGSYPLGILIEVAGKDIEKDLEGVIERRIHEFTNYIQGVMHLNQRDDIWIRISKEAYGKGLNSLKIIGEALLRLFKAELSFIEKMQITFYTDPKKVEEFVEFARNVYNERDARARTLSEEDVEEFYNCVLCQSFAPQHVCTITPDRISLCGAISWFDARAAARVDPHGPISRCEKGELLDPTVYEYSGVNEASKEKSGGAIQRVFLHSMFGYPHTSCGCFEALAFYIPEVDGIGIVDRDYTGDTPFGIPFSRMAGQAGGGVQVEGLVGMAIEYLRSPKFFIADGGIRRVVWMPSKVKEEVKDAIPEDLYDKIATEKDAVDLESLKKFLQEKGHPVVERWKEMEEEEVEEEIAEAETTQIAQIPAQVSGMTIPLGGGMKIILENAKIHIDKVIIRRKEKE